MAGHRTLDALSPEQRLLYAAARSELPVDELRTLVSPELRWGPLVWLAEMCRATPVLWMHLKRLGDADLPPEARALQHAAMVSEFRMRHLESRLDQCLDILEADGIPVMLLKGAGLAKTVYESFVDRPMSDLDILVPEAETRRAWDALRQAGWAPAEDASGDLEAFYEAEHHHLPPLYDPDGTDTAIEVHRQIFPGSHPFGLNAAALWDEAGPLPGRPTVLLPSPAHQIIHLAIHFAWSHMMGHFAGWRTFRDVAHLMRVHPLDWEGVVARAREARATTSTYWTLRLARSLIGLDVPDSALGGLRPPLAGLHGALERSYAMGMLPGSRGNPSVALARHLWTLGMRPGWSGHRGVKPWDFSEPFAAPAQTGWSRLSHQIQQAPAWGSLPPRVAAAERLTRPPAVSTARLPRCGGGPYRLAPCAAHLEPPR